MHAFTAAGLLVLTGICVYAAGNYFVVALHRPIDFIQLPFAGMCLAMVGFGLTQVLAYQTLSIPEYVTILKWNIAFVAIFFMLFPWFIGNFTGIRPRPWLISSTVLFAVLLVLNLLRSYSLQFAKIFQLEPIHLPWGETVIEPMGRTGLLFWFSVALVLANIVFALYALTVAWRREGEHATLAMLVAITLFFLTAIEGILVRADYFHFVHLVPLGLLLMVIVMSLGTADASRQRLLASERRFRSLVEQSPFSIQVLAPDGRTRQVNPAWKRLWGVGLEEIGDYNILTDQQLIDKGVMPFIEQGFAGKAGELPPIIYNPADNQEIPGPPCDRWVRAFIYPIREKSGTIRDVILMHEDVTEKIQAEREKESMREQFVQAQKMESVGRLAAGVAHDFNNYLSAIIGYSELELIELDPADPMRDKFKLIYEAGNRAAAVTRQLLGFSRKQVMEMVPLNLNQVVSDCLHILRRTLGEDTNVKERLAAAGVVMADRGQIEQIVINLAVNARDAMPNGGDLIIDTEDVELDNHYAATHVAVEPGPYVMLAMTDTGDGMTPEMKEKIFEPFFTTKEGGKGTGLGLAMVHGIVKQHNGHIFVYSEKSSGTTFKVYFPAITEAVLQTTKKKHGAPLPHGKQTILVVDDEPAIRQLIVDTLQPLGYTCLDAPSGEEALKKAGSCGEPLDLLLTDVIMPGMNGKELSDSLQRSYPGLKTVYMSGYTESAITHRGILDSGVAYLAKPITPTTLAIKLQEVLEQREPASPQTPA